MSGAAARAEPVDNRLPCPNPETTVFLIPDIEYDKKVINAYLKEKYRNVPKEMVVSQVNTQAVPHIPGFNFIVLVRRPAEDQPIGPDHNIVPDERGILRVHPIDPKTYVHEVHESKPILVRDYVKVPKAQLFQAQETDIKPLIQALCDAAYPCRVTVQNKPDFMLRCVIGV